MKGKIRESEEEEEERERRPYCRGVGRGHQRGRPWLSPPTKLLAALGIGINERPQCNPLSLFHFSSISNYCIFSHAKIFSGLLYFRYPKIYKKMLTSFYLSFIYF